MTAGACVLLSALAAAPTVGAQEEPPPDTAPDTIPEDAPADGLTQSIMLTLPPLSVVVLKKRDKVN